MRVFTTWVDEMSFLTPHAREIVEAQLKTRRPEEQFRLLYDVKPDGRDQRSSDDARRADAAITSGTDHPSWGEYFAGFGTHRELHAFVLAGIPPAGRA